MWRPPETAHSVYMARNAAYTHVVEEMKDSDLFMQAAEVRALDQLPGWQLVLASIDAHKDRLLAQLLNPTAKQDDVDRLRGEIRGLGAARDAAETIVAVAEERERTANRAVAQEHA